MKFNVIGDIREVELIARGTGVKIRAYLRKAYGRGLAQPQGNRDGRACEWFAEDSRSALVRGSRNRTKGSENQTLSRRVMKQPNKPLALCIDDTDYKASLIPGKVYRLIPDARAAKDDFVRVVDESGEDCRALVSAARGR